MWWVVKMINNVMCFTKEQSSEMVRCMSWLFRVHQDLCQPWRARWIERSRWELGLRPFKTVRQNWAGIPWSKVGNLMWIVAQIVIDGIKVVGITSFRYETWKPSQLIYSYGLFESLKHHYSYIPFYKCHVLQVASGLMISGLETYRRVNGPHPFVHLWNPWTLTQPCDVPHTMWQKASGANASFHGVQSRSFIW